jgi:hypothetical protein
MKAPWTKFVLGWAVSACLAVIVAACSPNANDGERPPGSAALSDPSTASVEIIEKRYAPGQEAEAVTGDIAVSETYRMDGGGETVLTVTGENGMTLEARLLDSISGDATVAGQPIRSLMGLTDDATPSHYRISAVAGGALCGEDAAPTNVVLFETTGSPPEDLTLLITTGGAPGEAGAVLCQVLRYTRSGA